MNKTSQSFAIRSEQSSLHQRYVSKWAEAVAMVTVPTRQSAHAPMVTMGTSVKVRVCHI